MTKKNTGEGRDILFTNTNKHIRLLKDKVCFEIISVQQVNSTVGKEFCWLLTLFGGLLFREFISEAVWNLQVGLNGTLDYLNEDSVSQQMAEDAKERTIDHVLVSLDAPQRNKNLSVTHSGSLSEENNSSEGQIC